MKNKVFGKLLVIGPAKYPGQWVCDCACGKTINVATGALERGTITSCGCMKTVYTVANPRYGVYVYHGKEYTPAQLAKLHGVNRQAFLSRFKRGWSVERAVETPTKRYVYSDKPKVKRAAIPTYLYKGTQLTVAQLVQYSVVSYWTLYNRLQSGWDAELATTKPARRRAA